jgi:hypothetical protein
VILEARLPIARASAEIALEGSLVPPALVQLLRIAAVSVIATVFIVAVAIGAYAFGSFLLMGRHVSAREIGASLRALVRELWIAGWTQPLIPLFYLVGYRMDAFFVRRGREGIAKAKADAKAEAKVERDRVRVPVIFVHGYMQNRVGFIGLARALAREGVGPLFGFNYPSVSWSASARRPAPARSTSCATRWAASSPWR